MQLFIIHSMSFLAGRLTFPQGAPLFVSRSSRLGCCIRPLRPQGYDTMR